MTSEQTKIYREIILDKCFEKAQAGSDIIDDNDILDIVSRCESFGIKVTDEDLTKYCLIGE